MHGVDPSHIQCFAILLVEFHEVVVIPFLQPVEFSQGGRRRLWGISYFSQFCAICSLDEDQIIIIRPTIDSWCKLLVTGLQVVFAPLIITLLIHPFSQFSIQLSVCSFILYFISLAVALTVCYLQ